MTRLRSHRLAVCRLDELNLAAGITNRRHLAIRALGHRPRRIGKRRKLALANISRTLPQFHRPVSARRQQFAVRAEGQRLHQIQVRDARLIIDAHLQQRRVGQPP